MTHPTEPGGISESLCLYAVAYFALCSVAIIIVVVVVIVVVVAVDIIVVLSFPLAMVCTLRSQGPTSLSLIGFVA